MNFLIILSTLALLTSSVKAFGQNSKENCFDIDIKSINPNLQELFSNPRSQGQVGWCYAYAAADLLSAEKGVLVSAAHVSSLFNRKARKNFVLRTNNYLARLIQPGSFSEMYEGGWIKMAAKTAIAAKSLCTEKSLAKHGNYQAFIKSLESIQTHLKDKKILEKDALDLISYFLNQYDLKLSSAAELFARLQKENINLIFADLLSENCELTEIEDYQLMALTPPVRSEYNSSELNTTEFIDLLDETIQAGRPVGIEYKMDKIIGSSGPHASVVIGRRWHNGQCQYKVRNSWGKSCGYLSGIDCIWSEGSFWVNDSTLLDSLTKIIFIKR